MKHYVVLLVTVLLLSLAWPAPATSATLRADLTHADSGRGFTKRELLHRMFVRSRSRAAKLCPSGSRPSPGRANPVTAPVVRGASLSSAEYVMHFGIGTPRPQHVALEVNTGSDLIWTQCRPCFKCFQQPFPTLDTSASSTVHGVACSDPLCQALEGHACLVRGCAYQYCYGDKTETFGQLAKDSFTFQAPNGGGTVTVPDLAFGCATYTTGNFNSNESGIAGFGRGPLSLPGQLKVSGFSYCFTAMLEESSKSSPVFLGNPDDLRRRAHATGPIMSTPFVQNPPGHSTYYYLSLKGVTVGETRLPVPESAFALKADGSGGTIIDSGSSITQLPHAVFRVLREAFVSQVPLPHDSYDDDDDHKPGVQQLQCFLTDSVPDASKVPVPKLVLHLEGGADWELPRENYMAEYPDSPQLCLVIGSVGDDDLTIIGNFQQQNMHIVHDLAGNKLVIVPAQCHKM